MDYYIAQLCFSFHSSSKKIPLIMLNQRDSSIYILFIDSFSLIFVATCKMHPHHIPLMFTHIIIHLLILFNHLFYHDFHSYLFDQKKSVQPGRRTLFNIFIYTSLPPILFPNRLTHMIILRHPFHNSGAKLYLVFKLFSLFTKKKTIS